MMRAASIRRTRARRSSRIFSKATARSRKTEIGNRKSKGIFGLLDFRFPVSDSRTSSSESPDAPLPPVAPGEFARGFQEPRGHARRDGPPERLPRKQDERGGEDEQRQHRHDPVVDERGERDRSPDRPGAAEDDAHREDREDIAQGRLREGVHSQQLVGEGVLEKPEPPPDEDGPRRVPAPGHEARRDQEAVHRPRAAVTRPADEELQGRRRRQETGDPAELHGPALPAPPVVAPIAGEGASTSTSASCENRSAGVTRISRNRLRRATLAIRPMATPRG